MKLKKLLLLIVIFAAFGKVMGQQDPLYSQYMFNPFAINPAYAGNYDFAQISAISRWQWVGLEGSPSTNTVSFHTATPLSNVGAGIQVMNDQIGASSTTEVTLAGSYTLDFLDKQLSFGLNAGAINHSYDYNKLNLQSDMDPNFLPVQESVMRPTIGFGMFYRAERYFAGVSIPRLLNVNLEDGQTEATRYLRHYYLNGGFLVDLGSEDLKLKPSALLKVVEGAPLSLDLNGELIFNDMFWTGLSFRNGNALGVMAQMQITNVIKAGYALEIPLNSLNQDSFGTHEFILNIAFPMFDFHAMQTAYF